MITEYWDWAEVPQQSGGALRARPDEVLRRLGEIAGIGIIVSTAMRAAIVHIHRFFSGRPLASWSGITAKASTPVALGGSQYG